MIIALIKTLESLFVIVVAVGAIYGLMAIARGLDERLYAQDGSGELLSRMAGDANGDGSIDIGDSVYILNYVFKDGPPPVPISDLQFTAILARIDTLMSDHETIKHILGSMALLDESWPRFQNGQLIFVDSLGHIWPIGDGGYNVAGHTYIPQYWTR